MKGRERREFQEEERGRKEENTGGREGRKEDARCVEERTRGTGRKKKTVIK